MILVRVASQAGMPTRASAASSAENFTGGGP